MINTHLIANDPFPCILYTQGFLYLFGITTFSATTVSIVVVSSIITSHTPQFVYLATSHLESWINNQKLRERYRLIERLMRETTNTTAIRGIHTQTISPKII